MVDRDDRQSQHRTTERAAADRLRVEAACAEAAGHAAHDPTGTRASISTPDTRNTQNSDSGRKIFQPSRISWS